MRHEAATMVLGARRRLKDVLARRKRVLCLVVHYAGEGSQFQGGSTVTAPTTRRNDVEQVVAALKALPFRMDVRVVGIAGHTLVPLDVDLSGVADPRHLVYAAVESLAGDYSKVDYVMVIEDDILVTPAVVRRMIDFADASAVNEIFLPWRVELGSNGTAFAPDAYAPPTGWLSPRRTFDHEALGHARNSHSGLTLLSRAQFAYALGRVDLSRREQFHGGYMASAFANLHLPFLVWKPRDPDATAHRVVHLDRWRALRGTTFDDLGVPLTSADGAGFVDRLAFDGPIVSVSGWSASPDGRIADEIDLTLDGSSAPPLLLERVDRPDVVAALPGAALGCGFVARYSLHQFPLSAIAVSHASVETRMPVSEDVTGGSVPWPTAMAESLASQPNPVPDEPHLPVPAAARLRGLLAASRCYLEYGSGGSTMLAARLGVPQVWVVESDVTWLAHVAFRLSQMSTATTVHLRHADIGPTGEWGWPIGSPEGTAAADLALSVWGDLGSAGQHPDLVLVDGRYRVACFLTTLLRAAPGVRILFDDYTDRPSYMAVEQVLEPVAMYERTAEFVVPDPAGPGAFDRSAAAFLLARHTPDPR